ncbi:hypothetical protein HK101_001545 [Irineochytrium annulatum]|nr:hypothetical protein HK101_001545 [Irineochytrium annulatum]
MERRAKKFWFTKTEEEIAWEQWTVAITVAQSKTERDQIEARKSVEKQLLGCLLAITEKCNEHKDHVPPILNNDTYPFPFQIMGGGLLGTHVRATVNATVYEGLIFAYDPSMGLLVLQSNPSNASPSTATANASASSSSSSSNHTAAAANGPSAKPSAAQTRPDFHVLKTTFISEIVVASTGNALLLANIDEQHFGPTETSAGSGAGAVGGANGDDKGGGGYAALVPVGPVPLDRILAREHAALKAETERVMKIGVGVSREGQSLFNALDKTLPTRWKGDKMIVMDDIVIAPPYTVNDVQSAGDATQVAQVKKVLEAERKRLQSKK